METLKEKLPLYQPKYIVKFDSCVDDQIRNLNGFVDPNKNGMKAGEGNMEAKTFMNNIVCEKEAFSILTQ